MPYSSALGELHPPVRYLTGMLFHGITPWIQLQQLEGTQGAPNSHPGPGLVGLPSWAGTALHTTPGSPRLEKLSKVTESNLCPIPLWHPDRSTERHVQSMNTKLGISSPNPALAPSLLLYKKFPVAPQHSQVPVCDTWVWKRGTSLGFSISDRKTTFHCHFNSHS